MKQAITRHTSFARVFLHLSMLPVLVASITFLTTYAKAIQQNAILANSVYPALSQELVFSFFLAFLGACALDLAERA